VRVPLNSTEFHIDRIILPMFTIEQDELTF